MIQGLELFLITDAKRPAGSQLEHDDVSTAVSLRRHLFGLGDAADWLHQVCGDRPDGAQRRRRDPVAACLFFGSCFDLQEEPSRRRL